MSLPSAQNLSITIGLRGGNGQRYRLVRWQTKRIWQGGTAAAKKRSELGAGCSDMESVLPYGSGQKKRSERGGAAGGALVPVFEEPLMRRGTVPRHEVRPQPLDHVPPRNQLLLVQEVVIHEQRVQHLQAHGGS